MKATEQNMRRAVSLLKEGKPLIIPTDTVYGLGVAVGLAQSPDVLFEIKQRDFGKPIAWLVGGPEALSQYGKVVPEFAHTLARTFWPGPLTLVVKASDAVPEAFKAENSTIALRMPDNEIACELIKRVGVPLATTSANMSGQKPSKTFDGLATDLIKRVELALQDEREKSGVSSTVVDCTTDHPIWMREGDISIGEIQARV